MIVLRLVSSVSDPIGLGAPYTVKERLLLKDIWRLSGQQWVDDLQPEVVTKFLDRIEGIPGLSDIVIPRAFFQGNVETLDLHQFGNSSQNVFSVQRCCHGEEPRTNAFSLCIRKGQSRTHESLDTSKT